MSEKHPSQATEPTQEQPQSQESSVFELFLAGLAIFSLFIIIALLILPSYSLEYEAIVVLDIFIALAFLADFIHDFIRAESKATYMRRGWVALLAGIPIFPGFPPILNVVRIARLIRLVQIIRRLRLKTGRQLWTDMLRKRAQGTLLGTVFVGLTLLVISSFLIVRFESGVPGSEIETVGEGFYWGFITITTVGYGDFVPVTPQGRMLAGLITMLGIIVVAVATSYVTSTFQGGSDRQEDFDKMVADMDEVKKMLQQLLDERDEMA